ncbi:MAG: hypothetical protein WAL68_07715, partial [Candidatus Binatus sp.]
APTRRTRRLMRRPYFPDARMFFEMTAPTYSIDPTRMFRFLADPDSFAMSPASPASGDGDRGGADAAHPPGGERRRRRRRRHRPRHRAAAPSGDLNPPPSPDPTRRD